MNVRLHKNAPADVTLLLEGTYPYIRGGVSGWVHQMISGLPEYTFSLVFLGGAPEHYGEPQYTFPDNVVHFETHFLLQSRKEGLIPQRRRGNPHAFRLVAAMHEAFRKQQLPPTEELARTLSLLSDKRHGITQADFLYSEKAWEFIRDSYRDHCTDPSFIDYFWTIRMMHAPIFMLDEIARSVPDSRFFHSISTGYAGFLGAMIALRRKRRLLITEHGIYTKERKIDLAQAEWITDHLDIFSSGIDSDISYIRRLWVHFFEGIGRIAYEAAETIIALYEANRQRQIEDGADAKKTMVIPNGIDVDRFLPARHQRPNRVPPVAALIGRVVPIKDIKTFIRAMHLVCARLPEAEGWIVGPETEDPEYALECRELVRNLGLEQRIRFLGTRNVEEIFPRIGVNVLTSISEALPLVVIEGYAAGVPVVATDVGACRELVQGNSQEDRSLGKAGIIVPIANPEATGEAIVHMLTHESDWRKAQQAAIQRVEAHYAEPILFDAYRKVYRSLMEGH